MSSSTETAAACLAECQAHQQNFPDVAVMPAADLKALLDARKPVTLLDVRTEEERAVSIIRGALTPDQLTRDELARRSGPEHGPLVIYCTVGYRSSLEARRIMAESELLPQAGVYSMPGILAWVHEDGEVVDASGQPTRRLHCFGSKWAAMAPPDCAAETFPVVKLGLRVLPVVWATIRGWVRGWVTAVLG